MIGQHRWRGWCFLKNFLFSFLLRRFLSLRICELFIFFNFFLTFGFLLSFFLFIFFSLKILLMKLFFLFSGSSGGNSSLFSFNLVSLLLFFLLNQCCFLLLSLLYLGLFFLLGFSSLFCSLCNFSLFCSFSGGLFFLLFFGRGCSFGFSFCLLFSL